MVSVYHLNPFLRPVSTNMWFLNGHLSPFNPAFFTLAYNKFGQNPKPLD